MRSSQTAVQQVRNLRNDAKGAPQVATSNIPNHGSIHFSVPNAEPCRARFSHVAVAWFLGRSLSLSLSLGASQLRLVFGGTIGTATGLGTQIRQRPPEILATSAHSGERATESVRPDLTVALRRDDLRRACILCSNTYLAAVFSVLMLHCRGASINLSINTLSYTI